MLIVRLPTFTPTRSPDPPAPLAMVRGISVLRRRHLQTLHLRHGRRARRHHPAQREHPGHIAQPAASGEVRDGGQRDPAAAANPLPVDDSEPGVSAITGNAGPPGISGSRLTVTGPPPPGSTCRPGVGGAVVIDPAGPHSSSHAP